LKNSDFSSNEYFGNLLEEIRASECKFYKKITDIYATAMDYSADSETTQAFFAPSRTNSIPPSTGTPLQKYGYAFPPALDGK